eukprot:symbB.v1.2.035912.t1/scaffold4947.1/size32529/3
MVHYRTVRKPDGALPVPQHHYVVYGQQPPVAMFPPVAVNALRSPTPLWQVRADPRGTPAMGHREVAHLPCTPSVRVGIPRSPTVLHREVRVSAVPPPPQTMPGEVQAFKEMSTPSAVHREVQAFKEMSTPSTVHREVRVVTPVVQHRPVAMATPVTTPQTVYREVRPRPSAPAVATRLSSASPKSAHCQCCC